MKGAQFVASASLVLLTSLSANADIISVSEITAEWVDVLPVNTTDLTIDNASDPIAVNWGQPATQLGQSGFLFDDASTPFAVDTGLDDGVFFLGNFTHQNNPTFGTPPSSVGLSINVSIDGVAAGDFGEIFTLLLDETFNVGSAECCDDFVTFGPGTTNSFFTLGGNDYFIRLLGFSNDDGATLLDTFASPEFDSNTAGLWGQIVEGRPTAVPAPPTLLLLGGALLALAALRGRS